MSSHYQHTLQHKNTCKIPDKKTAAANLTCSLAHVVSIPVTSGYLGEQFPVFCMNVAAHFRRGDSAQIFDVIGAIHQQPAISWGVYEPP